MEEQHVRHHAAQIIGVIDDGIRSGTIPRDALTFDDVSKHAATPDSVISDLNDTDRAQVVGWVDEILRIRAGGVY